MTDIFYDRAFYDYWVEENWDCYIVPYVQKHYAIESWENQLNFMSENPYFAKTIIEEDEMSNSKKQDKFLRSLGYGKSKIVVIVGARGSGKTATAMWKNEELHLRDYHGLLAFVGFKKPEGLPKFIKYREELDHVSNGFLADVDEGAIKYNARNHAKQDNKDLVNDLVVLRHKGVSVVVLTQNTKLVDVNLRRLADIIVYKKGANLDNPDEKSDDERTIIRRRLLPREVSECLVEIKETGEFYKFSHGLASFWTEEMSKSFFDFSAKKHREGQSKVKENLNSKDNDWGDFK